MKIQESKINKNILYFNLVESSSNLVLLKYLNELNYLYLWILKRLDMRTNEIIKEIKRLPLQKRIFVIEKTIHSIRKEEEKIEMKKAAESLYIDYKSDKELSAFTNIDFEDFYETR